jgi:hypothetical protein
MLTVDHVCPFCEERVTVYQPRANVAEVEFMAHGDCGHFCANRDTVAVVRSRPDVYRRRKREWVLAQNSRGGVPRLQP